MVVLLLPLVLPLVLLFLLLFFIFHLLFLLLFIHLFLLILHPPPTPWSSSSFCVSVCVCVCLCVCVCRYGVLLPVRSEVSCREQTVSVLEMFDAEEGQYELGVSKVVQAHARVHKHTNTHMCIHMRAHVQTHTCSSTCMHAHVLCMHVLTRTHARGRKHTHVCMHTHTHTHTHTHCSGPPRPPLRPSPSLGVPEGASAPAGGGEVEQHPDLGGRHHPEEHQRLHLPQELPLLQAEGHRHTEPHPRTPGQVSFSERELISTVGKIYRGKKKKSREEQKRDRY